MTVTYVVSLSRKHFEVWCKEHGRKPRGRDVFHVSTSSANTNVRGRKLEQGDSIVYYGPWYRGKAVVDALEQLEFLRTDARARGIKIV